MRDLDVYDTYWLCSFTIDGKPGSRAVSMIQDLDDLKYIMDNPNFSDFKVLSDKAVFPFCIQEIQCLRLKYIEIMMV